MQDIVLPGMVRLRFKQYGWMPVHADHARMHWIHRHPVEDPVMLQQLMFGACCCFFWAQALLKAVLLPSLAA